MKVVLLGILTLALQLRYGGAVPVSERDPIYPYLAEYQQEVEKRTAEGGYETANFERWLWVESDALAELFPTVGFATVRWNRQDVPGVEQPMRSRLAFRGVSLGVDLERGRVAPRSFEDLLIAYEVGILDPEDARRVWEAYCALYCALFHWYGREFGVLRVSENQWWLGVSASEPTSSGVEGAKSSVTLSAVSVVETDPESGRILSWEVDGSDTRRVPIEIDP